MVEVMFVLNESFIYKSDKHCSGEGGYWSGKNTVKKVLKTIIFL